MIDLRNRLEEATKQINSMAGEYDVMRDAAVAHDSVVKVIAPPVMDALLPALAYVRD